MAKIEGKFIVKTVGNIEVTQSGNKMQNIVFMQPGWTDDFGEKKGKDQFIRATVWSDDIPTLAHVREGMKVKATLNVQFREYFRTDDPENRPSYIYNAYVQHVEVLN